MLLKAYDLNEKRFYIADTDRMKGVVWTNRAVPLEKWPVSRNDYHKSTEWVYFEACIFYPTSGQESYYPGEYDFIDYAQYCNNWEGGAEFIKDDYYRSRWG